LKLPGQYSVTITDYSLDDPYGSPYYFLSSEAEEFVHPILRVWSNGYIVSTSKAEGATGCSDAEIDWWKLTTGDGETWAPIANDGCQQGSGVAPY
jgi:hypothetical protein